MNICLTRKWHEITVNGLFIRKKDLDYDDYFTT